MKHRSWNAWSQLNYDKPPNDFCDLVDCRLIEYIQYLDIIIRTRKNLNATAGTSAEAERGFGTFDSTLLMVREVHNSGYNWPNDHPLRRVRLQFAIKLWHTPSDSLTQPRVMPTVYTMGRNY